MHQTTTDSSDVAAALPVNDGLLCCPQVGSTCIELSFVTNNFAVNDHEMDLSG